jgi:hypothetical protein
MVGALSLTSLLIGSILAYTANRFPTHVDVLETIAGALLVLGLVLLGAALPVVS